MRLYWACVVADPLRIGPIWDAALMGTPKLLLSYHYYKTQDLEKVRALFPTPPSLFADSGAYSAHTQGAEVKLADYAAWIKRWEPLFDAYASLDVIGDPVASLANQKRLEDLGLRPLPVFHGGEPWSYLEGYCSRYSYVALGGMASSTADALRWAAQVFKTGRQTGTRFHGFGQTDVKVLRALPWYSADSSSWGNGHRYGVLALWDDRRARLFRPRVGYYKEIYRYASLIREHGGDPARLSQRNFWRAWEGKPVEQNRAERAEIMRINIIAWLRLERWVASHHGSVPPPAGWTEAGTRIYLAEGTVSNLVSAAEAIGGLPT